LKISLHTVILLLGVVLSAFAQALDLRYESGFPKALSFEPPQEALEETEAVSQFLNREFRFPASWEWIQLQRVVDSSHVHLTYELSVHGYPVHFHRLKIHYRRSGFIDYVTSSLPGPFEVPPLPERSSWESRKETAIAALVGKRVSVGFSRGKLGLWVSEEKGRAEWAFDVEAVPIGPELVKRGVVAVESGRVLERKRVIRHFHEGAGERASATINVYLNSPDGGPSSQIIDTEATKLKNSICHVQFDSKNKKLNEITPSQYSASGGYRSDCDSNDDPDIPTNCPNQKLDSGNVYYHLTQYRGWLGASATTLGTSLNLSYDPIRVIVDFMSKLIQDGVTAEQQANNAAYIGGVCNDAGTVDHCLVFLQPASQGCFKGDTAKTFFSLARESMVIAHEYQHYVTDMIAGIEFSGSDTLTVGDVVHEGYSDYFGASYTVKENTDSSLTTIGAYAFQNCSNLKRDLSTKPVFDNTTQYTSGHKPGLVWASGLWELRALLGADATDALALKSLYFVSSRPGFIDTVEALVQADRSLYGGAHEARIRTLFYDERKFLGSLSGAFQDSEKKIVKVGFQGCSSVPNRSERSGMATTLLLLTWLGLTLWAGRRWRSRL